MSVRCERVTCEAFPCHFVPLPHTASRSVLSPRPSARSLPSATRMDEERAESERDEERRGSDERGEWREETVVHSLHVSLTVRPVHLVLFRLLLRSSYSLASVFFPFVPYVTHFSHPLISFESERSEGRNEGRMTDRAEGTTRGPVPGS